MSNINVRVVGTANVTQMSSSFGKLQAQVTALNTQLAQMVALQNGVDPTGYERMTRAATANSRAFRNAAASTGMFEVQQLRLNRATDDYIKRLQKQQMSFAELIRQRKIASAAFKEQLAMEQMVVRQNPGGINHNRSVVDVVVPREVSAQLATAGRHLAFFNEQLASGAHQLVNWGKNTQWAGRQLTVGFTMPMLAAGAAAGVMAYQIDKEMTRIAKVYDTTAQITTGSMQEQMAVEKELNALRAASMQTALESARQYGQAATDTLNVQAELAATGIKGNELQKSTLEVMRISRLGELEHQDAINATIALQAVFRQSNEELTESFNYMNAVENATSLQTVDFAQAIPIAAAPVKAFGGDIRELGVLLTAMKERGIEATQGANAIKAAMQRLGRPSKQIQEEWTALTGTDITKIFKDAESLTELFGMIGDATADLSDKQRIKAFAGLFGTYQVTRMTALTEGMKNLNDQTTQVGTAFQLAGQSAEVHAATARREIEQLQKSISGQFDAALREMQIQLGTLGEPFVVLATKGMKVISGLIEMFNNLGDNTKILVASMLGIGAVAGPVIMLTGLFANLMGSGMKATSTLIGGITRLMGINKSMTTEQKAATLSAELQTTALNKEATAAQMLTMHLQKLEVAQRAATRATREGALAQMVEGGMTKQQAYAQLAAQRRADLRGAGLMNERGESTNIVAAQTANEKIADASSKTRQNWKNIGVGVATAATAGAAMLMTSDGIVGKAAEIVFYASLLGPILTPLGGALLAGFKGATTWAKALGVQMQANLATAVATSRAQGMGGAASAGKHAKAATGAAAAWGGMAAAASTFWKVIWNGLKVVSKAMGPIGWGIAALTAGVAVWKKINDSNNEAQRKQAEIIKEQVKGAKAIAGASKVYADNSGEVLRNLKDARITTASMFDVKGNPQSQVIARYESKEFAPYMNAFRAGDQDRMATQRFYELQVENGLTAKEAAAEIRAMYVVAGKSAYEADREAQGLLDTIGDVENQAANGRVNILRNLVDMTRSGGSESIAQLAPDLAYQFMYEFENAAAGAEAGGFIKPLLSGVEDEWSQTWENLDERAKYGLRRVGITTEDAFNKMIRGYFAGDEEAKAIVDRLKQINKAMGGGIDWDESLGNASAEARALEQGLIKTIQQALHLNGEFKTLEELFKDPIFTNKIEPVTDKTVNDFRKRIDDMKRMGSTLAMLGMPYTQSHKLADESKMLHEINSVLHANGVETNKIKTVQQAYNTLVKLANGELEETKGKIRGAKNETKGLAMTMREAFSFTGKEVGTMFKAGMQGVQQDIADEMRENFDESMNDALESRQEMWDRRSESMNDAHERQSNAMNARHERQDRALDARWERRTRAAEKYWEKRIAGVERVIEAEEKAEDKRQRMFENEINRINRLNEMANRNIDFNVALNSGDLDEAAKIRNDQTAADTQAILEAAANAGSRRSAKRIDRLEDRRDALEKAQEAHMDSLENREEAERRSLERRQRAEERHLERVQEAQKESLEAQTKADMEAQRDMWENRKKSLDNQLELFLSFIARNERELKKHMRNVGLSYKEFGRKVLKPKGEEWSQFFGDRLRHHIRKSGNELASDKVWSKLGKGAARGMVEGIGFDNFREFRRFVRTGKFPKKKYDDGDPDGRPGGLHEGGWVGGGKNSRKGVARTQRGLHPSERMVLAQDNEYVVDRRNAARNSDVLERISRGERITDGQKYHGRGKGEMGGEPLLAASMPAAMMANMFMRGVERSMVNAHAQKQAEIAASMATAGGTWGDYSLPGVKPWVLEAANWLGGKYKIGSILGVAPRSNYSEHPLGRALDFMVSDERGTKLADDVVKHNGILDAMYVIWRQRINSFDGRGWRPMEDRGSPTANHMDHVHVSFDPTGDTGDLPRPTAGGGKIYKSGPGGWHRPMRTGHFSSSHDAPVPVGTAVYAVANGRIIESRYITEGGSPGNGTIAPNGKPYRSYGETIVLQTADGTRIRYAHLARGSRRGVGPVTGGSQIARSGNTGNSSGPHLHMDINGAEIAASWLSARGIGLSKGASNINFDGVPAVLHKNEAVLTDDLNSKFQEGVDRFAQGPARLISDLVSAGIISRSEMSGINAPGMGISGDSKVGSSKKRRTSTGSNVDNPPNTPGKKGVISTATYNVWQKSSGAASRRDLAEIMARADVMALQEMRPHKKADLYPWLNKQGWGAYGKRGESSIAWNKKRYSFLTGGQQKLTNKRIPGMGGEIKYATYAKLKQKGGPAFWQISAHTIAKPSRSKKTQAFQNQQYASLRNLQQRLSKSAPVVMGADLNAGYKAKGGPKDLRKIGLFGSVYSGTSTMDDRKTYHDQILYGKGIKALKRLVLQKGMASDHNAVISNLRIPGLRKGTMDVRFNNTLANLHKGEAVLTKDINEKFRQGVDNFASGGNAEYNIRMYINEQVDGKKLFREFKAELEKEESRKPQSRRR